MLHQTYSAIPGDDNAQYYTVNMLELLIVIKIKYAITVDNFREIH